MGANPSNKTPESEPGANPNALEANFFGSSYNQLIQNSPLLWLPEQIQSLLEIFAECKKSNQPLEIVALMSVGFDQQYMPAVLSVISRAVESAIDVRLWLDPRYIEQYRAVVSGLAPETIDLRIASVNSSQELEAITKPNLSNGSGYLPQDNSNQSTVITLLRVSRELDFNSVSTLSTALRFADFDLVSGSSMSDVTGLDAFFVRNTGSNPPPVAFGVKILKGMYDIKESTLPPCLASPRAMLAIAEWWRNTFRSLKKDSPQIPLFISANKLTSDSAEKSEKGIELAAKMSANLTQILSAVQAANDEIPNMLTSPPKYVPIIYHLGKDDVEELFRTSAKEAAYKGFGVVIDSSFWRDLLYEQGMLLHTLGEIPGSAFISVANSLAHYCLTHGIEGVTVINPQAVTGKLRGSGSQAGADYFQQLNGLQGRGGLTDAYVTLNIPGVDDKDSQSKFEKGLHDYLVNRTPQINALLSNWWNRKGPEVDLSETSPILKILSLP